MIAGEHIATAGSGEISRALWACDFPLFLWDENSGVVLLANQAATDLTGLDLDELIGRAARDLLDQVDGADRAAAALRTGAIDDLRAERHVLRPQGPSVRVFVWTRTVEVDGRRQALSLVVPHSERSRLGRDPVKPWRDLAPVAVGVTDDQWRIATVSTDIARVLGGTPASWRGVLLSSMLPPEQGEQVSAMRRKRSFGGRSFCPVEVRDVNGGWITGCVLVGRGPEARQAVFAIVGTSKEVREPLVDRVADLELRLRRIGAEVRAAGVLDAVHDLPSGREFPQLGELTTRQWEILSLMLKGARVPAIAKQLYVSPSTVRNHLSAIFKKFGVHSQPELMELLQGRAHAI